MLSNLLKLSVFFVTYLGLVTQFAVAGDSRGGGDIVKANLASKDSIRREINEIKPSLLALFNRWEMVSQTAIQPSSRLPIGLDDPSTNFFKKLYGSPDRHTIFSEISSTGFDILENGPCHDLDGKEVDASAFNTNPNKVCFSLDRLSQKLSYSNKYLQVLALAAHELSHRVSSTEKEAEFLQNLALDTVTNKGKETLAEISMDVKARFKTIAFVANEVLTALSENRADLDICINLTPMSSAAMMSQETFLHTASQSGLMVLGLAGAQEVNGLSMKAAVPVMYCLAETDPRKIPYQKLFNGREQIPVSDLMKQYTKTENDAKQFGNLKVRYIKSGDKASLRTEIIEIRDIAIKIQNLIN